MGSTFLEACQRRPTPHTPIWLMRQAGRYMREYRRLRRRYGFLTLCKTPELIVQITLLPVEKFGVDAAILFSDLLLPLEAMGLEVSYTKGEGPIVRGIEGERIAELRPLSPDSFTFLTQAIKEIRRLLPEGVPLIGFAGAPFTLLSYMIEGGGSKDFSRTRAFMYGAPERWHQLMGKVTEAVITFLNLQIEAGCHAVQLFDSWAGSLPPFAYREFALPYTREVFDRIGGRVPCIHFSTGTAGILKLIKEAGGDVIGIDWRTDLGEAWRRIGYEVGIQGNLDPAVLLGPKELIEREAKRVLEAAGGRPGHIFNLGHGVLPQTPEENVRFLVQGVKEWSRR